MKNNSVLENSSSSSTGEPVRSAKVTVLVLMIMAIVLSAALLTGPAVGPAVSAEETAEERLSLEEALLLLEEHSTDLKIAELELSNAGVAYDKAQAELIRTESRLQELSAELQFQQAQQQYRSSLLGIYLTFMNDYQELQNLERELEIAEEEVGLARRKLREVEDEVEAGYEPLIELLRQQMELNNSLYERDETEADLEKRRRDFRSKLELEYIPYLTSRLVGLEEMNIPGRQEAVEMALDHSSRLETAGLSRDLARVELERAELSDSPSLDILELENNLELAELEVDQVREEVEEDVLDQLHRVNQAGRQVELAGDNLEQAEEHLRITREQREAGLISRTELDEAQLERNRVELEKQQALTSYMAAYFELREMLGVDLEVIRDEILSAFTE